ncbi:hypothetical protein BH11BAC3_BH11BAC3_45140 [soil metagenome]
MDKISPKKYIETKARNLPVYKCLITNSWEADSMASIIVMRRHVTGNVTLGYYLIDLLCLGVKDTFYQFNVSEEEAEERFGAILNIMEEIEYNLAHNVIYAAHDFAMEFDIKPHKDFNLTKYILAEDNDDIPLIDIHTGAEDGKPHLMINPQGQGKWALQKLIENAGEGNYYYTTEDDYFDDEEEEDDDDVDFDFEEEVDEFGDVSNLNYQLSDYPFDTITAFTATTLPMEVLTDTKAISKRSEKEIVCILLESLIRTLQLTEACMNEDDFAEAHEMELVEAADEQINYKNEFVYIDDLDEDGFISQDLEELSLLDDDAFETKANELLTTYGANLFAVSRLYQYVMLTENETLHNKVCQCLAGLAADAPYAKLMLAFNSAFFGTPDIRFSNIVYSKQIENCFEGVKSFGEEELLVYWLIKILKSIADNNIADSAFYYKLAVESCVEDIMFWQTQGKLLTFLTETLEQKRSNSNL